MQHISQKTIKHIFCDESFKHLYHCFKTREIYEDFEPIMVRAVNMLYPDYINVNAINLHNSLQHKLNREFNKKYLKLIIFQQSLICLNILFVNNICLNEDVIYYISTFF